MNTVSRTTISLEGALSLRDAKTTCRQLAEAISAFDSVEVDPSGLTSLDISIVQLLISARKSAARQGRTLTIAASNSKCLQTVLTGAGLLGLDGESRSLGEDFWLGGKRAEGHAA